MKITRSELNRLIESFLSEDLLTEKVATNIKNQIEEIDKCFNSPNEVPKTKEQLQKEKYPHELVKATLKLDKKELKSKIEEFEAIIDDIRRTPSGEGDKKKMRSLGRAERYEEFEVKLEILNLTLKYVEESEQQQKTEKQKPTKPTSPTETDYDKIYESEDDIYHYKVDKDTGCWITKKKSSTKWLKIKGNPKIKDWKKVMAALDKKFPQARSEDDKKRCDAASPEKRKAGEGPERGVSNIEIYDAISEGKREYVYVTDADKNVPVYVVNPWAVGSAILDAATKGEAISAAREFKDEVDEGLVFMDSLGNVYFYGENMQSEKIPYFNPVEKEVRYYSNAGAANLGNSFFRSDAGLNASRLFNDIIGSMGTGDLEMFLQAKSIR